MRYLKNNLTLLTLLMSFCQGHKHICFDLENEKELQNATKMANMGVSGYLEVMKNGRDNNNYDIQIHLTTQNCLDVWPFGNTCPHDKCKTKTSPFLLNYSRIKTNTNATLDGCLVNSKKIQKNSENMIVLMKAINNCTEFVPLSIPIQFNEELEKKIFEGNNIKHTNTKSNMLK